MRFLAPLLRLSVRWDVALSVCRAVAAVGLVLILTGCGTSGAAHLYASSDPASGYDPGVGLRLDVASRGNVAAVGRLQASNAQKDGATSGHTYAASAGVRVGRHWYAEPGWIVYGYESRFANGAVWRKQRDSWYAALGYRADDWSVAARYVPSPGDNYDSDELELTTQIAFGRMSVFAEPSIFRLTMPSGSRETHSAVRAGIGVRW